MLLPIAAFAIAFCLCTVLTTLGIDKFYYVQAGGGKFATFSNIDNQLWIGVSYLLLHGLYLIWLSKKERSDWVTSFSDCVQGSVAFLLLAFFAYPLGNDVYLYLHSGLMNLQGVNPFLTPADEFMSTLLPFVDWGQTSTYGPISQLIFSTSALAIPISPLLALYFYKGICLGLHIFNGYLVWRLVSEPQRGQWAIAYLVNPLLLMEQVSSGHVDVLVNTSFLSLAALLLAERYALVFLPLWLGFLSKTLPLIWIPLVTIFLLRRRLWWQLAANLGLSLVLIAALSGTVLPDLAAWKSLFNPGVIGQYRASLPELAQFGAKVVRSLELQTISLLQERLWLRQFSRWLLYSYASFYGWVLLKRLWQRHYKPLALLEDLGWVTLILMLLATPWVMPWYASSLWAIAVVLPKDRLFPIVCLTYMVTSAAQYALQGLDGLGSLITVVLPILVILFKPNWESKQSPSISTSNSPSSAV